MDDKRLHLMKNEKVDKAINTLAKPAIIGMLVMAIYNIVDSLFVSMITDGGYEVAATQIVLPIMLIASSIGLALGIGGGSYISRLLGKNNKIEANKVATVTFITGIILGIIITAFNLLFLETILNVFGADINTLELAKSYGQYIVIGYMFTILNMIMNNMLRSEGSSKYSMTGMAIGSVVNIILDPIFIFVFNWGIAGAAIATTISQVVSTVILFSFYFRKKAILRIHPNYFKPSRMIYTEILKIGVPTFFRQLLVSIAMGIMNNVASDITTDLVTSISIVSRVTMIPMYIVFGLGQGFQPVAGYNYGSGDKTRVMDSFKYTLKVSTIIMIIFCAFFFFAGDLIFDIYNENDIVRDYGIIGLKYFAVALVFMGVSNTIAVFFQSMGRGFEALILSVARQGLFFIPLILILPNYFAETGILSTQMIADLLTLVLSVILVLPYLKTDKLELLIKEQVA